MGSRKERASLVAAALGRVLVVLLTKQGGHLSSWGLLGGEVPALRGTSTCLKEDHPLVS